MDCSTWSEVSASEPCPICKKGEWCARSNDGIRAMCRRLGDHPRYGRGRSKTDKSGGQCWIFTLQESHGYQTNGHIIKKPDPDRADDGVLNEVYSALLGQLVLSVDHRDNLRKRGLPDEDIEARGYKTLPIRGRAVLAMILFGKFGDALAKVPGFVIKHGERGDYLTIAGAAGIVIPCRDIQGRIVALKERSDNAKKNRYTYISSRKAGGAGPGARVHVPLGIAGPVERVRLTEGELKSDIATALSGMPTIALPGVSSGAAAVPILQALGAKTVAVAFDADSVSNPTVARALAACVKTMRKAGFVVEVERWDSAAAKGIDDALTAAIEIEVLTDQAAIEGDQDEPIDDGKPQIIIGTDEKRVNDEAVVALAASPDIYQRGGLLVHVIRQSEPPKGIDRPHDSPRIVPMTQPSIRETLADMCQFITIKKTPEGEKIVRERPPHWCYTAIEARGQWDGIRHLEAVAESPVLRADGAILQTAGYDPASGLLLQFADKFPAIPDQPTAAEIEQAKALLLDAVCDFPFAAPEHLAAWLASVLTPLARHAFRGPSPLFAVDANTRGSGKSLLVDVTAMIASGRAASRMSAPKDDEEARKRITAIALAGEPIVLIDNLHGPLGCASLDAALTGETWSDRILGASTMASNLPLRTCWFCTGNNIVLQADTARRTLHVRLDSPEERPEERSGFKHPSLLRWIRANRPALVAAALTILRGYCAAGRPDQRLTPWGSFESWSDLVRSAVTWADLPDPGETRTKLAGAADRETALLRQ